MKGKFFGLNKGQVYKRIDEMKKQHEAAIEAIKLKIDEASREKQRLLHELDLLKSTKESIEKDRLFMEMAEARLNEAVKYLEGALIRVTNAAGNIAEGAAVSSDTARKCETIDDSDIKTNDSCSYTVSTARNEPAEGISASKVVPYRVRTTGRSLIDEINSQKTNRRPLEKRQDDVARVVNNGEPEGFWEMDGITASSAAGTAVNTVGHRYTGNYEKPVRISELIQMPGRTACKNNSGSSGISPLPSDFWDTNDTEESKNVKAVKPSPLMKPVGLSSAVQAVSEFAAVSDIQQSRLGDRNIENVKENRQSKPVHPAEEKRQHTVQQEHSRSGEQITEEVASLRSRYIVGKVAGDTLLDNNGRVIISKNSIITEDIVERADREGKLAELIINMILPGMES